MCISNPRLVVRTRERKVCVWKEIHAWCGRGRFGIGAGETPLGAGGVGTGPSLSRALRALP